MYKGNIKKNVIIQYTRNVPYMAVVLEREMPGFRDPVTVLNV